MSIVQIFKYVVVKEEPLSMLKNYREHRRLRVFHHKGTKCVSCGLAGTKITHGLDKQGYIHMDVTTDDFFPITVDHIIPKSKGGSDDLDNLQPMCSLCNANKGNGDIPIPKKPKLMVKKGEITTGTIVYRKNKRKVKLLGKVSEILINDRHPEKELSCKIEGNQVSLYSLKTLYVKS